MPLAVISDIHANREALDAVLASIAGRSVDGTICLGDIVDYGVDFDYCIETVRNTATVTVMGNHDAIVAGKDSLSNINREAQK
ncbi:MAG: metallophosphoesterase family protein, partial [Fidelibacterota bacterium]